MEPFIDASNKIIYEDEDIIAVSKSGNCPVHEGGRYKENCLVKILERNYGSRVFPLYRLDRETSGIVIFAKKAESVKAISIKIFHKEYIAVCKGRIDKEIIIDEPIGEVKGEFINWKKGVCIDGKNAVTHILPMESYESFSIIKVIPLTGRQHQIRVHLKFIGHPLIGDKIYGECDSIFKNYLDGKTVNDTLIDRQALHLHKVAYGDKILTDDLREEMLRLVSKIKQSA
jgi:23S rRNA pseudouridine1911/1915/1917 synthase